MLNIRSKKDFLNFVKQFIKFGIVGVSNTAISLIIYYLFIFINKEFYILGNTVGFFVSVINAYYWNNKYVFKKSENGHAKPFIKTLVVYGTTFLLGTGFLYIMVNYWGVSEAIAPLINLLFTVPANFLLNKFWAFR